MKRTLFLSAMLMLAGRGGSFLLLLMYSNFLNAEQFGYLSLLVSMATIGAVVVQFGGQNFFLKETVLLIRKGMHETLRKLLFVFSIICLIGSVLYIGIYGQWGTKGFFDFVPFEVAFLSVFFLGVISIYCAAIRSGVGIYQSQVIEQFLKPFLGMALFPLAYFITGDYFVSGLASFSMAASICGLTAVFLFFWKTRGLKEKSPNEIGLTSILSSAIPIYFLSLSRLLTGEVTPVLSSYFVDIDVVGIVRFYMQVCLIVSFPLVLVNYYFGPKFSSLFDEKKHNEVKKIIRKTSIIGSAMALFIFLCFAFYFYCDFDFLFPKYLTQNNREFFLMGAAAVLNVAFGPVGLVLLMSGNAKLSLISVLIAGLVNFLLLYLLAPHFGLAGVAWAYFISTLLWNVMMYYMSKSVFRREVLRES